MKTQRTYPIVLVIIILASFSACKKKESIDYMHRFPQQSWYRYNILSFEVPVADPAKTWDVYFFLRHTNAYEFNTFDFNMVMNTPSGEERIREYHADIRKKDGTFPGTCTPDSCDTFVLLKNGISFGKQGILKVEIEELVPRLQLNGVIAAGIRISPHS